MRLELYQRSIDVGRVSGVVRNPIYQLIAASFQAASLQRRLNFECSYLQQVRKFAAAEAANSVFRLTDRYGVEFL
jgi:hypothetical protein